MEPIRVSKIVIQGVKGILKPVELSLGKSSKPCSLAIFASNACGKSGIADALEYFFNEKGEVDHLGIKGDSETGGKPARPHIHASKAKIPPQITLVLSGGQYVNPITVKRDVKTGTKDELPAEITSIVDSARAIRILRQHDLRRFVVDYEPSKKYDKKLGISVFQNLLQVVPATKDEEGKIDSITPFTFPDKIEVLRSSLITLEKRKEEATASVFKELWETGLPLVEKEDIERCPLCETEWDKTKYKSRTALLEMLKRNLESLKAVSDMEKLVAKALKDVNTALQNDKAMLTSIKERALAAGIQIKEDTETNFRGLLDGLQTSLATERCRSSNDVPGIAAWNNGLGVINEEIMTCVMVAEREINARGKEHPDRKRFHNARKLIADIIASKRLYEELQEMQNEYDKVGDALAKISITIRNTIKNQMKEVLDVLKKDISSIYKKINRAQNVPEIYIDVPDEKNASLNLRISFYDVKDPVPPGGYLSESYINSLGIAVFLAAVKNFNSSFPFVVLDDIVSSYDADHRGYMVDVIAEDFIAHQVILTTHDHMFYRHLKQRLQDKGWRFKQIKDWKIDYGPLMQDEVTDEEEIENLFTDKTNYQSAGNAVRLYMEEWFDQICHELGAHTPHRRGMHDYTRTLFGFWTPFIKQVFSFGCSVKEWLESQICYDRLKSHPLINYYSHFQSNPYEWPTMGDVEYVWQNFKEFRALFRCQCFGKLTYKSGDDKKPYCKKCGEWIARNA